MYPSSFWDNIYRNNKEPYGKSASASLIETLKSISPCKAIEIGCGIGQNSLCLAEKGFTVIGIDLSQESINAAAKHPNIRYVVGNIFSFEASEDKFGFFFDKGCYHCLDCGPYYAKKVSRLLCKGAIGLVLSGSDNEKIKKRPKLSLDKIKKDFEDAFKVLEAKEVLEEGLFYSVLLVKR